MSLSGQQLWVKGSASLPLGRWTTSLDFNYFRDICVEGFNRNINLTIGKAGIHDRRCSIRRRHSTVLPSDINKRGDRRERPFTHDRIGDIFSGLGVSVQRAVISDIAVETKPDRLLV